MALDLYAEAGIALEQQALHWRDMALPPISKLDDDAFTRVRIVLVAALEHGAVDFAHAAARGASGLREALARVRRVELHQALAVQSLLGVDHSALELGIAHKQCSIEVAAALAQREPDALVGSALRFGLLDDVDHLYRLAALLDRVEGKDANNIVQSYTDIAPGRPTILQHRAAQDDLCLPHDALTAHAGTPMRVWTMLALSRRMGSWFAHSAIGQADPVVRQVHAEIASVDEQHATRYESLLDPREGWLEQWLLYQANEAMIYHACIEHETEPRVKALWERMLDYEIGQFRFVADLLRSQAGEDPQRIVPRNLPAALGFSSQRDYVRKVLADELELSARADAYVPRSQESQATRDYRARVNAEGSPSEAVAAGYTWSPGTELARLHFAAQANP